jgi:hypothetical protein
MPPQTPGLTGKTTDLGSFGNTGVSGLPARSPATPPALTRITYLTTRNQPARSAGLRAATVLDPKAT